MKNFFQIVTKTTYTTYYKIVNNILEVSKWDAFLTGAAIAAGLLFFSYYSVVMVIVVMAMAVVADVAVALAITQVVLLAVVIADVFGLFYSFSSSVVAVAMAFPQIITVDVITVILAVNLLFQKRESFPMGGSLLFCDNFSCIRTKIFVYYDIRYHFIVSK